MSTYWTREEREALRWTHENNPAHDEECGDNGPGTGTGGCLIARQLATVDALEKALRDILDGQLGGSVDRDAPRFSNARALLAEIGGKR